MTGDPRVYALAMDLAGPRWQGCELCEQLLRGEAIPLSRLDADAVRRYGLKVPSPDGRVTLGNFNLVPDNGREGDQDDSPFRPDPTVTLAEFVACRDEATCRPLIECTEGNALPAGGLAILAATVGHGKTTLTVEVVLHAVAGRDYLAFSFPRPLNVLVIENEGPREAFRLKVEERLAIWEHGGSPRIWDDGWGSVVLSDPTTRRRLSAVIDQHRIDLVVSDSLTRFGVRGNGTPEETREFVAWLTELGLGRDVAFLLLHHPRTRSDRGENELDRLAGAWHPHADLILLLRRLDGARARLSFPKTRWTRGTPQPWLLAFDPSTESFSYVGDDVLVVRDLVAELAELMADGEPRTAHALRKPKDRGGVGADPKLIAQALAGDRFESFKGNKIGKRAGWTFYVLRAASRPPHYGHDATTVAPEGRQRRASPPIKGR